jgi:PAS domain S-box-containing protein
MKVKQYNKNLSVLVLTPTGKDSNLVCKFLDQINLNCICCSNLKELTERIADGQGPAVIAEEALSNINETEEILGVLENQPAWSDIPLLIIRTHQSYSRYIEIFAKQFNTTILKRPIHLPTFLSSIQSAVEARSRQIEIKKKTEQLTETNRLLKETKNHLLAAQSIAKIGSWEWDLQNNKIHWSEEVYRIFGMDNKKSELNYESFLSFVHPDDWETVTQAVSNALHNKENYSIEHRIIRNDSNERIVHERANVIFNAAHNPVRMIGTVQDVTENKKKEKRLHEQDLELKSKAELLDLAHDMIIIHDLDGKIIFWNKGAENSYGWKKEDVLGKVTHDVLKTKFCEPFLKIITSVSSKGNWEGELIHTAKNGKQITVESRWALQKDETGKATAILEIERDITERKLAEEKTEEARRFAESVIDTIQEALVVLDPELRVLSANQTFYKLFGLKPEETEGKFIYGLGQNQWDIPELRELLEDILPKNTSLEEFEMGYDSPKGRNRQLLLNARRIYRERKKTEMILLAIQDITQRKLQEKRIRELTEELLLAEEEQRQKVSITLHDSIGQMLAFAKRELASLLKEPNLRTESNLKKVLNEISRSVKQSRKLTTDLSSPTLHTFGLEAGIEELTEEFSKNNGVKCIFNTTEEPKPLEKKVELLLYNSVKELLCNITKHSRAKNIDIDVRTVDNLLELILTDDGKGFDTSILDKHNNKKKSFGLFSIQQRLTNVGGSFKIKSEKNKGTKVILRAPLDTTAL